MKRVAALFFIVCFLFALFSDSSLCSLCRPADNDTMTAGCGEGGEMPACASRCMAERTAPKGCGMVEAEAPSGCGGCPMARARAEASRPPCAQAGEPEPSTLPTGHTPNIDPSSRCGQCVLSRLHKDFTYYRIADPLPGLDSDGGQALITKYADYIYTHSNETPTNLRMFPTTVLRC